jgi:hypothetical protein
VAPVFNELKKRQLTDPQWVKGLLDLAAPAARVDRPWSSEDLSFIEGHWAPRERCLNPPVALLSWMLRNFTSKHPSIDGEGEVADKRRKLLRKDPRVIEEGLNLLRTRGTTKGWHVLEGPTCPDALIMTPAALIVVEGKRTEAGPTLDTTFLDGRHQMLRHLDAAWEIRGSRSVYGILIVEAEETDVGVPVLWEKAGLGVVSRRVIGTSLPHRSQDEQAGIANAFIGVATWQALCAEFGIPRSVLIDTVPGATASVPETGSVTHDDY